MAFSEIENRGNVIPEPGNKKPLFQSADNQLFSG